MSFLPKLTYRFNITLIKIPAGFFSRYRQADSKIHMERRKNENGQNGFEKEKFRGIIRLILKTYYKATVIKTVWYGGPVVRTLRFHS